MNSTQLFTKRKLNYSCDVELFKIDEYNKFGVIIEVLKTTSRLITGVIQLIVDYLFIDMRAISIANKWTYVFGDMHNSVHRKTIWLQDYIDEFEWWCVDICSEMMIITQSAAQSIPVLHVSTDILSLIGNKAAFMIFEPVGEYDFVIKPHWQSIKKDGLINVPITSYMHTMLLMISVNKPTTVNLNIWIGVAKSETFAKWDKFMKGVLFTGDKSIEYGIDEKIGIIDRPHGRLLEYYKQTGNSPCLISDGIITFRFVT